MEESSESESDSEPNPNYLIVVNGNDPNDNVEEEKEIKIAEWIAPKMWLCKACGNLFRKKSRLDEHFRSHSGERPYVCPYEYCGKTFIRVDHLSRHKLVHSGIRSFQCTEEGCIKTYASKDKLKVHERSHMKDPAFKCDLCTEEFDLRTLLRKHLLEVHGRAEFQCQEEGCSRIFPNRSKLETHIGLHKLRRYKCELGECNIYFATKDDLTAHEKKVHKDNAVLCQPVKRKYREHSAYSTLFKRQKQDEFICTVNECGEIFTTRYFVGVHIREIHDLKADFKCSYPDCNTTFTVSTSLKRHLHHIHGVNEPNDE